MCSGCSLEGRPDGSIPIDRHGDVAARGDPWLVFSHDVLTRLSGEDLDAGRIGRSLIRRDPSLDRARDARTRYDRIEKQVLVDTARIVLICDVSGRFAARWLVLRQSF